jgi:hypothetical protein
VLKIGFCHTFTYSPLQISYFCLGYCFYLFNRNASQVSESSIFLQARHVEIPYLPMLVPPTKWKGYATMLVVHAFVLFS